MRFIYLTRFGILSHYNLDLFTTKTEASVGEEF